MSKITGKRIVNKKWYDFKIQLAKIPQFQNLIFLENNSD